MRHFIATLFTVLTLAWSALGQTISPGTSATDRNGLVWSCVPTNAFVVNNTFNTGSGDELLLVDGQAYLRQSGAYFAWTNGWTFAGTTRPVSTVSPPVVTNPPVVVVVVVTNQPPVVVVVTNPPPVVTNPPPVIAFLSLPKVDGATYLNSANQVLRDKEIIWSKSANRQSDMIADNARPGVFINGVGAKVSGLRIHDVGQPGIFHSKAATGAVIEDCFISSCAVLDNENPSDSAKNMNWRGASLYMQSDSDDHSNYVNRVVGFNNVREIVHCYASDEPTAHVGGFQFSQFVGFNPGSLDQTVMLFQKDGAIRNTRISESHLYMPPTASDGNCLRYLPSDVPSNIRLEGNTFVNMSGPAAMVRASAIAGGGNTFIGTRDGVLRIESADLVRDPITMTGNTYYDPNGIGFHVVGWGKGDRQLTWAQWQQETGDNGKYVRGFPDNSVVVYKSPGYPGRALVVVWNWNNSSTATVDLNKTGLNPGQKYAVFDVQRLTGLALATGTFTTINTTTTVALPDENSSIDPVLGIFPGQTKHTAKRFNVLVVVPQ